MASNQSKSPVVRKYQISVGDEASSEDVMDIGACLSKLNHRLYRQGRKYRAKITLDTRTMNEASTSRIRVFTLMPTWFVHSAWRMAKKAYDDALADEKAILSAGNLARWRDFRVAEGAANIYPAGSINPQMFELDAPVMGVTSFTAGEFNYSTVENLDTGNATGFSWPSPNLAVLPGHWFDIMAEFTNSRNESAEPETIITDMPYHELMSDANDDDYVELQANGNEPPYNANNFPDHLWVCVGTLQQREGAGNGWVSSTGFFDAPCGLVYLDSDEELINAICHVEVAGGDYRGVHAPAM